MNTRLLVVTQAVNRQDPVLGFFHTWLDELAGQVGAIRVICLFEGEHELPTNVRVSSLGKETGRKSRLTYALRFLKLAWSSRGEYDAVLVHMNEEYVLLAGLLWKLLGKRTYMWRNHYAGSWRTDIAAHLCTKIFCTSRHSYTANYPHTVFMPVGIDTKEFKTDPGIRRVPRSVLFLARMAPSKRPEMLVNALRILDRGGIAFTATFVGSPALLHERYYRALVEDAQDLAPRVTFLPGVTKDKAPDLYRTHDLFVNCTASGSYDKTLFEAAACGAIVLAVSSDYATLAGREFTFSTDEELAHRLRQLLAMSDLTAYRERLVILARSHALTATVQKLAQEME